MEDLCHQSRAKGSRSSQGGSGLVVRFNSLEMVKADINITRIGCLFLRSAAFLDYSPTIYNSTIQFFEQGLSRFVPHGVKNMPLGM